MLSKITAVFTLLPTVLVVVQMIESMIDPTTSGAEKKRLAMAALRRVGVADRYVAVADSMIDTVVSLMNAFGVFQRSREDAEPPLVEPSRLNAAVVDDARLDALLTEMSR